MVVVWRCRCCVVKVVVVLEAWTLFLEVLFLDFGFWILDFGWFSGLVSEDRLWRLVSKGYF